MTANKIIKNESKVKIRKEDKNRAEGNNRCINIRETNDKADTQRSNHKQKKMKNSVNIKKKYKQQ